MHAKRAKKNNNRGWTQIYADMSGSSVRRIAVNSALRSPDCLTISYGLRVREGLLGRLFKKKKDSSKPLLELLQLLELLELLLLLFAIRKALGPVFFFPANAPPA